MAGTRWDWPNQQVVRADCSGPGQDMSPGGYGAAASRFASYAALKAGCSDYGDLLYADE